jgi:hypothetical protein
VQSGEVGFREGRTSGKGIGRIEGKAGIAENREKVNAEESY